MAACSISSHPLGIALIGNPGAGKSTILNGIAGGHVFESGNSIGTGLTTILQKHQCSGHLTLFDTPGLADIAKKQQAGEEIDKVLAENLSVKIAFVVTLERGRVKPDDANTIKIVLEAIKSVDVDNMFGVILNQLSAPVTKILEESMEKTAMVRKSLTGRFETSHWVSVPRMGELEDKDNGKLMNEALLNFFAALPETKPPDAEIMKIDTSDMEDKIEEQNRRINELLQVNDTQKAEMAKQLELQQQEATKREMEIKKVLAGLQQQLTAEREMETYKRNKIVAGISNFAALSLGTAGSLALLHPAPLIAAAACCRTVKPPNPK